MLDMSQGLNPEPVNVFLYIYNFAIIENFKLLYNLKYANVYVCVHI